MNRFLILMIAFAGLIISTACSSKSKQAEPVLNLDDSRGARSEPPMTLSPADERPVREVSVPESSKGGTSESKYKALAQVLRGQNVRPGVVQDEITKILGTNPNDPVALNALALLHLRRGRPGAAKLLILRALEKKPTESAALYNNLGVALLEEGDNEAALVNFKKALQLDDRHAEAMGNLGSLYAQGGDLQRAAPLLEGAYRSIKSNLSLANNYAIALRAKGDYAGARSVYEEILKANSKDASALLNYAILLIDFMNKPKDGLDLVYRVKLFETDRKDVLNRANALEKKAKSELK